MNFNDFIKFKPMKNILPSYIIRNRTIAILVAILFLSSCTRSSEKDIKEEVGVVGIELSESIINMYQQMQQLLHEQEVANEELLFLLNMDDSVAVVEKDSLPVDIVQKNIIFAFRQIYVSYDMLIDANFSFESSNIRENIAQSTKLLWEMDLDESVYKQIKKLENSFSSQNSIPEEALLELDRLFLLLMDQNMTIWQNQIEEKYHEYAANLQKISLAAFDEEKIKTEVNKPYSSTEALVKSYKLQLREKAYNDKNEILELLTKNQKALSYLAEVHAELLKKNADNKSIKEKIDFIRISTLIVQK